MSEVSLMVLPRSADAADTLASFYVLRHGSWHEAQAAAGAPGLGVEEFRHAVETLLEDVMKRVRDQMPIATFLQGKARDWWEKLVPPVLKQALDDAREEAEKAGEVPRLLVHAHPSLEWMPWELLHNGADYLGLRFQVARLPIVVNGGIPPDGPKYVSSAINFLGTRVFDEHEDDKYQEWASTFDSFVGAGVAGHRWPSNGLTSGGWPTLEDLMEQRTADIIHVTAHGGVDNAGRQYLALDVDDDVASVIDDSIAGLLNFESPGPLVFGNACGSMAAGQEGTTVTRGLGVSFFDRGAAAYVGSMAPLSKDTAIGFATTFYQLLLEEGHTVGEALRQAKCRQQELGMADPSYLFYCLYGLPQTRFVPVGPEAPDGGAEPDPGS